MLTVTGGLLLGSIALPAPAGAVDKFAAEFLKIGIGARALGMGGSFVSISDDASASYWNPAGLIQLESREAMGMHASQFGGVVDHDVLGVITPLSSESGRRAAIGLTLIRLAVDNIRVTKDAKVAEDPNGNPIIDPSRVVEKSAYDLAFIISYARSLGDRWATGVNVKLIRQSLVGEGASFGVGVDLGMHFLPSPSIAIGARFSDITTTQLWWDTGRRETVAPSLILGAHTTRYLAPMQGTICPVISSPGPSTGSGTPWRSGSVPMRATLRPGVGSGINRWVRTTRISPTTNSTAPTGSAPWSGSEGRAGESPALDGRSRTVSGAGPVDEGRKPV
jgi:hypothetical protein